MSNLTRLERRVTRVVRSKAQEMIDNVWMNPESRLSTIIIENGRHIIAPNFLFPFYTFPDFTPFQKIWIYATSFYALKCTIPLDYVMFGHSTVSLVQMAHSTIRTYGIICGIIGIAIP